MADFIKINGIYIPTPASFDWQASDLDVSGERSASGHLIRDRVRVNVHKLEFNWAHVDRERFYNFMRAMMELPEEFDMEFPEATGEMITRKMYRGADLKSAMYMYKDNKSFWKDCKTSFIEI